MTEWVGAGDVLPAFHEAMSGPLRTLRESLPDAMAPSGPTLQAFDGLHRTGGGGHSAFVTARREDGRQLYWQVEFWAEPSPSGRGWTATVKGEIDLDDDEGDDRCVLNEQHRVSDDEDASASIRLLADVVSAYPLDLLLTMTMLSTPL